MKSLLVLVVASFGSLAYGSHTVCSSPTLYYSLVQRDVGVRPLPGTELGTKTIVAQGKLLHHETLVQGSGGGTFPRYEVTLVGPKKILQATGNQIRGVAIFTQTAVLSSATPGNDGEIERCAVVCEQTWAMVP